MEDNVLLCEKICPSPEELSMIVNNVKCEQCGLVFRNKPRYQLHDLKVHQHKKLDKIMKKNVHYHCPVQACVYAINSQRYFNTLKYLKQHYLKVHVEKNHVCDRCGKSFSIKSAKEGHLRVCGIEYKCSCSKSYTTYEALLTHAKRSLHTITKKYKNSVRITNSKIMRLVFSNGIVSKPITILPNSYKSNKSNQSIIVTKRTSDIGVQTDDYRRSKKMPNLLKFENNNSHCNTKRQISKQTQTNGFLKKNSEKSMETQTQTSQMARNSSKIYKSSGNCVSAEQTEHAFLKEDLNLDDNFTSTNLFPASPLPLHHDVVLQDFWEDKNTSSTQTLPEKDMFEAFNDNVTQTEFETFYGHSHNSLIQCVPKSSVGLMTLPYAEDTSEAIEGYSFASSDGISQVDPMLTAAKTLEDKFSSIETQTEQIVFSSYYYPEPLSRSFALSSNIETQTTDNLDNMEQLLYSNTCTQTCNDEMLSSDLGLSNIQTQTTWSHDTTVSTETQTKSLICETGCNISMGACRSWLNAHMSHTETQTDLLSIFEEFQ